MCGIFAYLNHLTPKTRKEILDILIKVGDGNSVFSNLDQSTLGTPAPRIQGLWFCRGNFEFCHYCAHTFISSDIHKKKMRWIRQHWQFPIGWSGRRLQGWGDHSYQEHWKGVLAPVKGFHCSLNVLEQILRILITISGKVALLQCINAFM